MSSARTRRPRLSAAAAVALAVTGTLLAAPAALATPAAPVSAVGAAVQGVAPFPENGTVLSAGETGFLAKAGTSLAPYFWTSYDGTVTALPGARYLGADGSDTVVQDSGDGTYALRDMGSDAPPVVITTPGRLVAVVDTTLVTQDAQGFHLVSRDGDRVERRTVTGLPGGEARLGSAVPGALTVLTDGGADRLSLVDTTTASVVTTVTARNSVLGFENVAGSPTHLTWYDYTPADDGGSFHLYDRATGRTQVLDHVGGGQSVALSEDWLAVAGGGTLGQVGWPLLLRSLADGRETEILDRVDNLRIGADGAFLVQGVDARERGVYRITVGADGEPAARLVASSGRLPDLTMTVEDVPKVVDFDDEDARVYLSWDFNLSVAPKLTLTHTATGRQRTLSYGIYSPGPRYRFVWNGDGPFTGTGDYSGEYTWKMTATETSDVGPGVERTGTLTLNRPATPRDFDANGFPDVLARDTSGGLSAYEAKQLGDRHADTLSPTPLGTGWNTYTLTASPSDRTLVGRDRDGVLWMHRSEGQKLLHRTKVGGGWQVYNKITGGSDLNGDGRGDLLATDTSGVLWLYTSTGDTARPFHTRKKIGGGWQVYNLLTAPGNIAGATGGDLLARDKDGVLWLYLGKGDGTFTARRQIGGGWQKYTHLVPAGTNGNGAADVYAVGPTGLVAYTGLNSTTRPFGSGRTLTTSFDPTRFTAFF
ncbi:hypothetical protein SNE510_24590 [Streptomyces sp. NE5-10]|uniref:hypothetical protein n=1 Tax=Streptomyces sp. NE5-10 TaxID=2759674 RepID=UPI001904A014|nr:hypothetical protein [Streptomyces sp. NE5-10]GHJ92940.1 hypothetical protein SNE510_24590 [Streptomyces sp. NE5-10]